MVSRMTDSSIFLFFIIFSPVFIEFLLIFADKFKLSRKIAFMLEKIYQKNKNSLDICLIYRYNKVGDFQTKIRRRKIGGV